MSLQSYFKKTGAVGSLVSLVFILILIASCASTQYLPNISGDVKKSSVFVHGDTEIVYLYLVDNQPRDFISNKFFRCSYSAVGDLGQFNIGISPGNHSFVFYTNKYWNEQNLGGSFRVDLNMEEGKTYILKRKPTKEWIIECNKAEVESATITPAAVLSDYTGSDAAYLTIPPFKSENKVLDDKSWQSIDIYYIDKIPGEPHKGIMGPYINNYDTPKIISLSPGEHELLLSASTRSYNAPSIFQKMIITLKPGEKAHLAITKVEAVSGGAQVTIEKITDAQ